MSAAVPGDVVSVKPVARKVKDSSRPRIEPIIMPQAFESRGRGPGIENFTTGVILHPRQPGITGSPLKHYPLYLPSRGHGRGAIIYGPREVVIGLGQHTTEDPEQPPFARPFNKVSFGYKDNPNGVEEMGFYVRRYW